MINFYAGQYIFISSSRGWCAQLLTNVNFSIRLRNYTEVRKEGMDAQRSLMKHKLSQTYSDEIQARAKHILMKHQMSQTHSVQLHNPGYKVQSLKIWWYFFTFNISNPLCWHSMSDTLTFYSGPFGFHSSLKYFQWKFGKEIWNVIEKGSAIYCE